jgi:hypothetical protein
MGSSVNCNLKLCPFRWQCPLDSPTIPLNLSTFNFNRSVVLLTEGPDVSPFACLSPVMDPIHFRSTFLKVLCTGPRDLHFLNLRAEMGILSCLNISILSLLLLFILGPPGLFSSELIWKYESFRESVSLFGWVISPVARPLPTQGDTNTEEKRQISMSQVRFEPTTVKLERAKSFHALGSAATVIVYYESNSFIKKL